MDPFDAEMLRRSYRHAERYGATIDRRLGFGNEGTVRETDWRAGRIVVPRAPENVPAQLMALLCHAPSLSIHFTTLISWQETGPSLVGQNVWPRLQDECRSFPRRSEKSLTILVGEMPP